jgi:hypothetical protein
MTATARKISTFIISAILLANTACTTIKPVYNVGAESYASQVKIGDRVRLTQPNQTSREIVVTEVSETEVTGTIYKNTKHAPKGHEIIESWSDLDSVETVKISAVKTVGAGLGVVVAIPFLVVGLLMFGAGGGS